MNSKAVLYDLDGTLASNAWRTWLVEGSPKRWETFFLLAAIDSPIPNTCNMLARDKESGHEVIIATGRPERYRDLVVEWLARHGIRYDRLIMRADSDRGSDVETKAQLAAGVLREFGSIGKVVEDRRDLDEMWRGLGLRVVEVSDPGLRPDEARLRSLLGVD